MQEKSFINQQLGIKFNSYIDRKCRVWFKAKEVAQILGYKNTEHAIKRHVSENHKMLRLCCPPETGGQQNDTRGKYCLLINEAGFYELVFRSKLPAAKMFREWVFTKVLPCIRKFTYYKIKDLNNKIVKFDGKKYYKHQVFSKYAASKNGNIINVKTKRIIKMMNNGYGYLFLIFVIKNLKNQRHTLNIDLFTKFLKDQFHDFLKLII